MLRRHIISEQTLSNVAGVKNIFSLSDENVLIADYDGFFIWNLSEKKIVSRIKASYEENIVVKKIEGSPDCYMVRGTKVFDDDFKIPQTSFYKSNTLLGELSYPVDYPVLLTDSQMLAVEGGSHLAYVHPKECKAEKFLKFDNEVAYLAKLNPNKLVIVDKVGTLHLYEIKDKKLNEIKKIPGFKDILTIHDLNDKHFICVVKKQHGSHLQLLNKETLDCISPINIEASIEKLEKIAGDSLKVVGCTQNSKHLYLIDFEKKLHKLIAIAFDKKLYDFAVLKNGKAICLLQGEKQVDNCLIELDLPLLIKEFADEKQPAARQEMTLLRDVKPDFASAQAAAENPKIASMKPKKDDESPPVKSKENPAAAAATPKKHP